MRGAWFDEMEATEATQRFLNATQNQPLLKGQQTNLYKCFLPQAWMIASQRGAVGLLHPEGVYDDPKAGVLRAALYWRLRRHFQFANQLMLFPIAHRSKFSINVHGRPCVTDGNGRREDAVSFAHICNLFAPATVEACLEHDGSGPVSGVKDAHGQWNVAGHSERVIRVGSRELETFAELYDQPGTNALEARLPSLHVASLLSVLRRIEDHPARLESVADHFEPWNGWHETGAVKDGTIRRETRFAAHIDEAVLSGPHYYVGNPLSKTPRRSCTSKADYDVLDLTTLPDDYIPRVNYVPARDWDEYVTMLERGAAVERIAGDEAMSLADCHRVITRRMVGAAGERTLMSAVLPGGRPACVNTSWTTAWKSASRCVEFAALTHSTLLDFFIKTTGTGELNLSYLHRLPILDDSCPAPVRSALRLRALALNCLTTHYAGLWDELFAPGFQSDRWAKPDPRLPPSFFTDLTPRWTRHVALRTDYARRQALIEIDVLASHGLRPHPRRAVHHLPRPIPRPQPERARHLVRSQRPHRVHCLERSGRGRATANQEEGRDLLRHPRGSTPRRRHRSRLGGHPPLEARRRHPRHPGRHSSRRPL